MLLAGVRAANLPRGPTKLRPCTVPHEYRTRNVLTFVNMPRSAFSTKTAWGLPRSRFQRKMDDILSHLRYFDPGQSTL